MAQYKCTKGNTVSVMSCFAGFYIGTYDDEGPCCRVSGYYKQKVDAETALEGGHFTRICMENAFACPNCRIFAVKGKKDA